MIYYTMLYKYGKQTRNFFGSFLFLSYFCFLYFGDVLKNTIIPRSAPLIWNGFSQIGVARLVGYLQSDI